MSTRDDPNRQTKLDDVIYAYPKSEGNKIAELRGLFETLPPLLVDVTDNPVKSSTLIVDNGEIGREARTLGRESESS